MFQQVTVKDPTYAPAHARLAIAHALMAVPSGSIPFVEAQSIIRPAAVKALELDPLLADAYEAMGWVHCARARLVERRDGFPAGHRSEPKSHPDIHQLFDFDAAATGKAGRRVAVPPRGAAKRSALLGGAARDWFCADGAGRYEEAISMLQRVRAVDPDFPFADSFPRAGARVRREAGGRVAGVRKSGAHRPRPPRPRPGWSLAYVALGHARGGGSAGRGAYGDAPPSMLAMIYAALGDKDRAVDALERTAFVEPQRLPILLAFPEMPCCCAATLVSLPCVSDSACRRSSARALACIG